MIENTYTLINKFESLGETMVTVKIKSKAACVMTELEYNRIIEAECNYKRKNRWKRTA